MFVKGRLVNSEHLTTEPDLYNIQLYFPCGSVAAFQLTHYPATSSCELAIDLGMRQTMPAIQGEIGDRVIIHTVAEGNRSGDRFVECVESKEKCARPLGGSSAMGKNSYWAS